ncbi:hypothetical protein IWX90DRAFT_437444 [Phyllosticta citrichinensis]|uniref:Uncharacterized protein n=1 Tax=Phyllosticta citrichinensis TaxID=1130410 RepID=A0ABR1XM82_9PEZI
MTTSQRWDDVRTAPQAYGQASRQHFAADDDDDIDDAKKVSRTTFTTTRAAHKRRYFSHPTFVFGFAGGTDGTHGLSDDRLDGWTDGWTEVAFAGWLAYIPLAGCNCFTSFPFFICVRDGGGGSGGAGAREASSSRFSIFVCFTFMAPWLDG